MANDVCSLSDQERPARRAMIEREILPHIQRVERREREVVWRLAWSQDLEEKLTSFVEFERGCCGSLDFDLRSEREAGALTLTVQGEGAEIFADASGNGEGEARGLGRLATAGGLGVGIAFFVCCVMPVAAGAVVGAAVAAPLATLDQPVIIASSSLVAGGVAWLVMRRREAKAQSAACTSDC